MTLRSLLLRVHDAVTGARIDAMVWLRDSDRRPIPTEIRGDYRTKDIVITRPDSESRIVVTAASHLGQILDWPDRDTLDVHLQRSAEIIVVANAASAV